MSRLEELIGELCPNGVEYFELQELFHIKNGYTPSKAKSEYWEGGTIPWFRMEDIRQNGNLLSESIQQITPQAVKGSLFPANSIIIATSATIGEHALITVESLANQRFTYLTRKDKYINLINPMFIYYYCYILDTWCKSNLNVSSFASVDMSKFVKFKFPLPPLSIQSEIIRILHNFTELTSELTSELTARKKQYEYYRNQLFTFDDLVEKKELGKVANFIRGNSITKKDITVGNIPVIAGGQKPAYYCNTPNRTGETIVISSSGAYAGYISYWNTSIFVSDAFSVKPNININIKYLYYVLKNKQVEIYSTQKGGGVPHVKGSDITNLQIPLPSLEEQQRIVSILDRFDALCNDLISGLPAEIEARRKQYEYYRDKLLTFKELST